MGSYPGDPTRFQYADRSRHPAFQAVWWLRNELRQIVKGDMRLEVQLKLDQVEETLKMWQPKPDKRQNMSS